MAQERPFNNPDIGVRAVRPGLRSVQRADPQRPSLQSGGVPGCARY